MAMHPIVNIATRAARKAGEVILRASDRLDTLTVTAKSQNDFVSEVDRQAEQEIIQIIRKAYPDHGILAEESGNHDGDEFQWIIDPLDGTTNYLHGFPQYAVSIAVRHKGKLEHGVVYDPLKDELFTASRGQGAQLNGRRLRVSGAKGLDGALIGTGFPFREQRSMDVYLEMLRGVMPRAAGIRRAGSAALDLAYVAAGRMDGFWELHLKPWDMAAGLVLIQEAGGLVGDLQGGGKMLESGHIVTGNARVFKELLQIVQPFSDKV